MTRQFTLPDLGEGLEEAEIVAWLVNEGDHVIANQPLVSVTTSLRNDDDDLLGRRIDDQELVLHHGVVVGLDLRHLAADAVRQ